MTITIARSPFAPRPLKRGIYETGYGNAAYVSGPTARTAYDLDMGETIPIALVTGKFLRKADAGDAPSSHSQLD